MSIKACLADRLTRVRRLAGLGLGRSTLGLVSQMSELRELCLLGGERRRLELELDLPALEMVRVEGYQIIQVRPACRRVWGRATGRWLVHCALSARRGTASLRWQAPGLTRWAPSVRVQLRLPICLGLDTVVLSGHGVCQQLALPPSTRVLVLDNVMRDARMLALATMVPRLKTAVLGMGHQPASLPPTVERLAVVGEPGDVALAQAYSGLQVRGCGRAVLACSIRAPARAPSRCCPASAGAAATAAPPEGAARHVGCCVPAGRRRCLAACWVPVQHRRPTARGCRGGLLGAQPAADSAAGHGLVRDPADHRGHELGGAGRALRCPAVTPRRELNTHRAVFPGPAHTTLFGCRTSVFSPLCDSSNLQLVLSSRERRTSAGRDACAAVQSEDPAQPGLPCVPWAALAAVTTPRSATADAEHKHGVCD